MPSGVADFFEKIFADVDFGENRDNGFILNGMSLLEASAAVEVEEKSEKFLQKKCEKICR